MSQTTEGLPSLLVFGPQTEFPPEASLQAARQELISNPYLADLRNSVSELFDYWRELVGFDPTLQQVPGAEHLERLSQWVENGGPFPHHHGHIPNHYALTVTVILQIAQYIRFIEQLGEGSHSKVLQSVTRGGIQGFCVGFLSALAVATSESEADIGASAATALRLAVAIGAYVDSDGEYSPTETRYATVAVRWRDGSADDKSEVVKIVESIPRAYISSNNDEASVTVTIQLDDLVKFSEKAREHGLRTKIVNVYGRFHSADHSQAVEKLMRLASTSKGLAFPDAEKLLVPVRNTSNGEAITQGSLTRLALENTLVQVADWYTTLKSSIQQLPESDSTIAYVGHEKCVPSSLAQNPKLRIFPLGKTEEPTTQPREGLTNGQVNGINGIHSVQSTDDLSQYPPHSIAIVGMAGRFPGAESVDELWDLIMQERVTVEPAPVERFNLPQTGEYAKRKWWGNFLKDSDTFDHKFFGKSSREAVAWDPQQRILLEVVYEALESAGYFGASSETEPRDYGCYIGAVMNNYYDNLSCHPGTAYATVGTSRCYLSGCMSHYFGWTGPSLTIDTACSSSLVAINTACRAIWSGECSRAVAGGTNVICSPFDYQNLAAAGFLSPSGQCKPFDADADGYCRGEAVAVVVLKPLAEAIKENDNILGVVVGSAANQNHNSGPITAPFSASQVELYQKCMKLGGVKPEAISYVEAHGTGTGVGDPIEVRSLRDAFGGPRRDSLLHFGSIKGNVGHTEATAGVTGLIKVLLMMRHRKITAQASHKSLNPKIPALDKDQMAIPRNIMPWKAPSLLACVNSYGAAGSNSAVILREKPYANRRIESSLHLSSYPLFISAGSANSLARYSKKLLEWLRGAKTEEHSNLLASLAFNLADRGNHSLPHTLTTIVSTVSDLETKLEAASAGSGVTTLSKGAKPVVLVFGGQESEFIGLSEDVYKSSKIFLRHLDAVNELLVSAGLESFYPAIFETKPIQNLVTLHSALFAVQYASAKSWIDCGLKVSAVVGHSFGQLTALCISGTLSLPNALKLVSSRAALMQKHWGSEPGSMLFLQTDRRTVDDILRSLQSTGRDLYAEIACYNGPESHVVVGSSEAIEFLQQHVANSPYLRAKVRTKKLNVTNGFHSKFTEPLLPHLTSLAEKLEWKRPEIHLETTEEFERSDDPTYQIVSEHTRKPVFFQRAVQRLASKFGQPCTWLEAGRGSSVVQLVKLSVGATSQQQGHAFHSPQLTSATKSQDSLTDITVDLWKAGYAVQYWPFHRSQKREYKYFSLPPIQFEKTRHWLGFTGRGHTEEDVQAVVEEEVEEVHELLTFLKFADGATKKQAVFKIDPKSDRFQKMLGGHVMAGQTLAPASLYFEVVARAALYLENDTEAKDYVPTVNDLVMRSPIGHNTNKKISLALRKLDDVFPSWSFSITTQDIDNRSAEPFEHSTGTIRLTKRDDRHAAREFERFETLTGYRRYDEVMNHADAEMMQGNHIYRAFNTVVYYGEAFRGIKQVACVRTEAAGRVKITPALDDPADQRLCDTPMTDSFMQFAGFLVNYFNNPSMEDVFVCQKIEHIEIGGDFDPDAGEWFVYSTMSEGGETDAASDAYIFDARTKKMVMAAFGFRFSKMSQALLARMLKSVNKSAADASATTITAARSASASHSNDTTRTSYLMEQQAVVVAPTKECLGKRTEVLRILSNVTDVAVEELSDDSTLDDLGVDSLMATEVLNDVRSVLGLTIDLSSFLFFPNIRALVDHVNERLGVSGGASAEASSTPPVGSRRDSGVGDLSDSPGSKSSSIATPGSTPTLGQGGFAAVDSHSKLGPSIPSALDAFEETRFNYDRLAITTGATDFWAKAYPHQARLVLAYVVEAFAELGCDLRALRQGDDVPQIKVLDKHRQLVRQLYRMLEDGMLIAAAPGKPGFVRSNVPIDTDSAESIYHQIIDLYPQHASVNKLVRAVGFEFAACLRGDKEAIQIIFGNRETKKTLEEMYEFSPLLRTPTLVLGDFLAKALDARNTTGTGKFRILEIGAGTGGTTRYIVNHLRSLGIDFEYVYTDLGASLVNAAAKQFKGVDNMFFEVLDIEKTPKPEYEGAFHCIIATNCIHATRDLDVSLAHIRKMLREDGALTLIEITKNMFWLDIVVGLLEGWWLFEDGREHALVDERHWERRMKKAGFSEVAWSDGATPESKTVRVIAAFPSGDLAKSAMAVPPAEKPIKAAMETVVYKKVGDLEIHADVYYPLEGETLPVSKMPVALMIHGGSHMLFSRKDIRPAQTRLLLRKGFLPVSLDYRLCPEVALSEGAMVDVCDALAWARTELPHINLPRGATRLPIDGENVVVVGWSSGGQLAMSLAWTAPSRGLAPPAAALVFYAPTDYEDKWWQNPIQPNGAPYRGQQYDVLEGVRDAPITNYEMVGAWEEPIADPRSQQDPRCRIVLHINWKAQTLPVILGGLPSPSRGATTKTNWNALPQPSLEVIQAASPRAHIRRGEYTMPTFFVHGTADDLIPWQQSRATFETLMERGVRTELVLLEGAPHICDLSSEPASEGWKAVGQGYEFLAAFA